MAKKPQKIETPEIDPEKWSEFEATVGRMLKTPHKPHKPKTGPKTKRPSAAKP